MPDSIEEFRKIPGFGDAYLASSLGRILSFKSRGGRKGTESKLLSEPKHVPGAVTKDGYLRTSLHRDGKPVPMLIHRLVAAAFLGPCPEGFTVNHKDGDKKNNRPDNLEYLTGADNVRHSYRTGLAALGERRKCAKLTSEQIVEIRRRYSEGLASKIQGHKHPASTRSLAQEFGVTSATISSIARGRTWSHVSSWPSGCPEGR